MSTLVPRWQDDAACNGLDPATFDVPNRATPVRLTIERQLKAAQTCARCPVRAECENEARTKNYEGVWGGVLFMLAVCNSARGGHLRLVPKFDLVERLGDPEWWADRQTKLARSEYQRRVRDRQAAREQASA